LLALLEMLKSGHGNPDRAKPDLRLRPATQPTAALALLAFAAQTPRDQLSKQPFRIHHLSLPPPLYGNARSKALLSPFATNPFPTSFVAVRFTVNYAFIKLRCSVAWHPFHQSPRFTVSERGIVGSTGCHVNLGAADEV
jgi:hypothetical protein